MGFEDYQTFDQESGEPSQLGGVVEKRPLHIVVHKDNSRDNSAGNDLGNIIKILSQISRRGVKF